MKERILRLLSDIESLKNKNPKEYSLPENVAYLGDNGILCGPRKYGDSRYAYEMDGLNLWVHANGYIDACESNFVIFRQMWQQEEAPVDFWGGIKNGDEWIPVSITGVTKPLYETVNVKRYMVYTRRAAFFIAETDEVIFSLRVSVTSRKQINFTASAINKTDKNIETYITSFINPMLRFEDHEVGWGYWHRYGQTGPGGSFMLYRTPNPEGQDVVDLPNYAIINKVISASDYNVQSTCSMSDFLGEDGRTAFNATSLRTGKFDLQANFTNSIGLMVASDIIKLNLKAGEEAIANYNLEISHDEEEARALLGKAPTIDEIEADLASLEVKEDELLGSFSVDFGDFKDTEKVNNKVFNRFLKNVQKQVSVCALGKNYVSELLGVRDVFQQLTATCLWNKDEVRAKIVRGLNFMMETGRPPRQFSVPPSDDVMPQFDMRQFIDQGYWIIETLYKYVGTTGDFSILDKMCTYYKVIDEKKGIFEKSKIVDSVLDHLVKITDYLVSNIDERTGCQKILYGDWNDAISIDLGKSLDGSSEFGTGVTVMGTLQLYQVLAQIIEILSTVNKYPEKVTEYNNVRDSIAISLEKHAMVPDGDRIHLLHGWGDKGAYQVGSLCDTDGKKRYSVNPYSFWCISDMIERKPELKKDILNAYDNLDSKYGIKTFSIPFTKEAWGVGRIATITPGTLENGTTYCHACTFATMALFILGEGKRAWEQIFKVIPISHEHVSKSPFVMSNCYFYNEQYGLDGQSANDWYTGSGAVLMRCIIEHAFGFRVMTDSLKLATSGYMPSDNITMKLRVKNCDVNFTYKNTHCGERKYIIDGALQKNILDKLSNTPYIMIPNENIGETMTIEVID